MEMLVRERIITWPDPARFGRGKIALVGVKLQTKTLFLTNSGSTSKSTASRKVGCGTKKAKSTFPAGGLS